VLGVRATVPRDPRESIRARARWFVSHRLALCIGTTSASDVARVVVVVDTIGQRHRDAGGSRWLHPPTRSRCCSHSRSWTADGQRIVFLVVAFDVVKADGDGWIGRLEWSAAHFSHFCELFAAKPFVSNQVHSIPGRAAHRRPWRLHKPARREIPNCCLFFFLRRRDILDAGDSSCEICLLHETGENFKPFIVRHPGARRSREGSCRRHAG